MTHTLHVRGLEKRFGGVVALKDLSFHLDRGEVLGLIGPNGSGKSTTVNTLAGVFPATSGEILLDGEAVGSLTEPQRVARGLSRTFQTASVFEEFTVRDQIALGCEPWLAPSWFSSIFGRGGSAADQTRERTEDLLDLCGLRQVADRLVGTIPVALQRFLMIATSLAAQPKVLLLDEPAAGMVKSEREELADLIKRIKDRGVATLVIEHHMSLIMTVSDRIVVLNFGEKIAEGSPEEIRSDASVIDAYLGEDA